MNQRTTPYTAGLKRGWLDFKHTMSSPSDLFGFIFPTGIAIVVILFLRNVDIPGSPVSLGSMSLPSMMGMNVMFGGMMGVIGKIVSEREDGTLLRNKAIPGGMTGYLIGSIVSTAAFVMFGVVVLLTMGLLFFPGVSFSGPGQWLTLLLVVVVGLFATMPIGAALGSLFTNPRMLGFVMMPIMALTAISGIFYPITALPPWLQWIGQAFPMYWMGLGMRSALLPASAVHVEIGASWRPLETFGVLALWAILGLVLAPALLRRMARRESGSAVAERQERAMQNVR
ncbi:MAG TPA: ABC transporter permease [Stackebrandtia sp.]|jgi:ABC-2 type transport system permease protein|uniref:ABC transporter permease n=1 Tax=Stackebrandtia sp. TaxID=2023065 RepID=UPI002D31A890|nr:ABC transporter permease [Stackebrandtia sp.]HZE38527.1 ABC transporter permease [Stackebrandtia sp.]